MMIKPVRIEKLNHPIFGEKEKVTFTVFSLEDKAKEYNDFLNMRKEQEGKLIKDHSEVTEKNIDNEIVKGFDNLAKDYLESIGFKKRFFNVSHSEDKPIEVYEDWYEFFKGKDYFLGVKPQVTFYTTQELKATCKLNFITNEDSTQGWKYLDVFKDVFDSSYKKSSPLAEPVLETGRGLVRINPPDYVAQTTIFICYLFKKLDQRLIKDAARLKNELNRGGFNSDITKKLLEKEYNDNCKTLKDSMIKEISGCDLFSLFRNKTSTFSRPDVEIRGS